MVYLLLLLVLTISATFFTIFNNIYIKTSTMASVMSLGIFIQGVLLNFLGIQFIESIYGKLISIINLSLWLSFTLSFCMTLFNGKFKKLHFSNPINRFGIGTWVAGTSICTILFSELYDEWSFIPEVMSYLNVILWIIYIGISFKALVEISREKSYKNVHGILLLTTVSTQSIVLLINNVFKEVPPTIYITFLVTGFIFYLVSALFILKRYVKRTWSIKTDWNNTNCILHGALSISGLACITTGIFNIDFISFIWFIALTIFIIVESVEVFRLIKRIKSYGFKKGVFIYDVSQWSRIFTFSMFYTFTALIKSEYFIITFIKDEIFIIGVWIIIILLIMELILSSKHMIETCKESIKEIKKQNNRAITKA